MNEWISDKGVCRAAPGFARSADNSVYWRHWISWRVQVVAIIPKPTEKKKREKKNLWVSGVRFQLSVVRCQVSYIMGQTCPLCTVGWYAKNPKPKKKVLKRNSWGKRKKSKVCQCKQYTFDQNYLGHQVVGVSVMDQTDTQTTAGQICR